MNRRASLAFAAALLTLSCAKPKPPELTPRSVQVSALKPDGVELTLQLDAHNPNAFPIIANEVTGVFELRGGTELGRGQSAGAFTIPGEQTQPLSATLEVRWKSLSLLAPYALAAKPLPYRLRGTARIGGEHLNVDVPYTIEGELTPEQVMQAGIRGVGSLLQTPK
jgi:LEA14-like dessication related protein